MCARSAEPRRNARRAGRVWSLKTQQFRPNRRPVVARSIAVTFDYRCPFAYNGNAAVVAALRAGSDIEFRFTPFSLDQAHIEEGETPVWDREPAEWGTGTLALQYGLVVRDAFPDQFFDARLALFAARHDKGLKLGHEDVVRDAARRGRTRPRRGRRGGRQR